MIKEVMLTEGIDLNLNVKNKIDLFNKMANILFKHNKIDNVDEFVKALNERESQGCTGMGNGIAIPHGKSNCVKEPTVLYCKLEDSIEYESLDDEPIKIIFMIAIPQDSNDTHLKIISQLARKLMHAEFIDNLINANSGEEILAQL